MHYKKIFLKLNTGSSAGAGSGDFHVYRGVRRREYARQKFLDEKSKIVSKSNTSFDLDSFIHFSTLFVVFDNYTM